MSRPLLVATTCGPAAVVGVAAAASTAWWFALFWGLAGFGGAAGVALLAVRRRRDRCGAAIAAGCLVIVWWAVLAVAVLPVRFPATVAAAAAFGVAGGAFVVVRARRGLMQACEAWSAVPVFVTLKPRYQATVIRHAGSDQLCRMWEESGARLGRVARPDALARYLDVRRMVLTELETRNPAGFAKWLCRSDGASPRRYLVREGE